VQLVKAAPSRLHSKVESALEELKAKLTEVVVVSHGLHE
jgi:hypothetical protein